MTTTTTKTVHRKNIYTQQNLRKDLCFLEQRLGNPSLLGPCFIELAGRPLCCDIIVLGSCIHGRYPRRSTDQTEDWQQITGGGEAEERQRRGRGAPEDRQRRRSGQAADRQRDRQSRGDAADMQRRRR
jgi:hypothetical protein